MLAIQRNPGPCIAFFDLDCTLVRTNSMVDFLRHHLTAAGRPASAHAEAIAALRRMSDAGQPRELVSRAYYRHFAGCGVAVLHEQGEEWFRAQLRRADFFDPDVLAAFQAHRQAGDVTVLVSGSLAPCVDPVARHVQADLVATAELEIVDGRYTGDVRTTMTGAAKADLVRQLAATRGVALADCYAYGDHSSDLPMLAVVGHPVVVGDDPVLVEHAMAVGAIRLAHPASHRQEGPVTMSAATESHLSYPVPRSTVTDPPREYLDLQQTRPVCPITLATGFPAMLVTRYEDVRSVLSDPRFSRDALFKPGAPRSQLAEPDQDSIISIDPPRHTRLRNLVNREFSPRRVEAMRPKIKKKIDELLEDMELKSPPLDLNECLGRPLALQIICDLLGVPYEDRARFGSWADHFTSYAKYPLQEVVRANTEMRSYLTALIDAKRAQPGEDLLSALVYAHDAAGALTEAELVSLGVVLLVAGHDTTVTVIGGGLVTLLRNPDQLAELRRDLSLMPQAVEELLRLNEPGDGSFLRIATEDLELGGVAISEGTAVIASISSANRDPSVFENPDRLDLHRTANPHLAFGHGPHFCLGSALARVELQLALSGLLARFPKLRLAVPFETLRWRFEAHLGGIDEVPVAW